MAETFTVDLTRLAGDGAFPCPKCDVNLSPDDESQEHYTILDQLVIKKELKMLLIQCKHCHSEIKIVGFLSEVV